MFVPVAIPPHAVAPPPARVLVFADEFFFNASRRAIPAGRLRVQLKNIGEDDHDFQIIGPRGTARAETGTVGSPADSARSAPRSPGAATPTSAPWPTTPPGA